MCIAKRLPCKQARFFGSCLPAALPATLPHPHARFPSACREFQEEVTSRARREMLAFAGAGDASGSGSSTADLGSAAPPDLPALVDDLRAEVAATRAVVQQLRLKQQQEQGGGRR